jgi:hypothetical protein
MANNLPAWNCKQTVCTDNLHPLVICWEECIGTPTKTFKVDAGNVIVFGSLVTAGATADSVKAWAPGDVPLGIAYCSADTTPTIPPTVLPDGCESICVIVRMAKVYASGLTFPAATTAAQKAAAILALEAKNVFAV